MRFDWWKIVLIGGAIVLVSTLHFLTPIDSTTAHEVYQRLYYLPVVAAALLFGLRGGLLSAAFASAAYIPHIFFQWHHQPEYALNQYAEIVLFFFFAIVTGALSDRNRREHERGELITAELERSYAELRQTFQQLLQAERLSALGEISAGIVHEIRNPLGAIRGAVEIIEDELAKNSPRREFALIAKHEVDRIEKLVQEFVRFARPPKLVQNLADVNELVESVAKLLEQQAAAQKVTVKKELAFDLPQVALDIEQIEQVLLNLAINALQAMPDGGSLVFRTFQATNTVTIEVEDTGGGIPQGVIGRVFDPFFTTKDKGSGLGLSVAHKIVMQHEGRLVAENTLQGAIFRLMLKQTDV
ncbi:MAG: ATP-binding protein [Acidobacteriota bacterium]|nr:ATP-binding protein [Acidobacteriota bacterium]